MKMTFRWYGENDCIPLNYIKQIQGMTGVVTAVYDEPVGAVWPLEKLLKAHENPDLYPDLVVRVTGFTAYFATLSPEFRQLVVDSFIKGM